MEMFRALGVVMLVMMANLSLQYISHRRVTAKARKNRLKQ